MKKKIDRDENMPVGRMTVVSDFLPPPHKLFPKDEKVKITITVDSETIRFFKAAAKKSSGVY